MSPHPERREVEHEQESALLDASAVALLLSCSARHVLRLSEAGMMPAPVRLGKLIRWRRHELQEWISTGCRAVNRSRWTPEVARHG